MMNFFYLPVRQCSSTFNTLKYIRSTVKFWIFHKIVLSSGGGHLGLYLTLESITKRHLDRFSHFRRADSCRQSTDTQTHTNHALSATLDTDQKLPVSTPAAVVTVLSVVIDCAVAIIVSTSDNSITCCCRTESERPHRGCHLSNNVGSRWICQLGCQLCRVAGNIVWSYMACEQWRI